MHDDDHEGDEVRQGPPTDQVRIVGAARAVDALGDPDATARADASDTVADGEPDGEPDDWTSPSEPQLLHWTDAPTGEVPAVLARVDEGAEDDPWAQIPEPTWREERHDWEQEDPLTPRLLGGGGDGPALLSEPDVSDRQPWSFDLEEGSGDHPALEDLTEVDDLDDLETRTLFGSWTSASPEARSAGPATAHTPAPDDADGIAGEKTSVLPVTGRQSPRDTSGRAVAADDQIDDEIDDQTVRRRDQEAAALAADVRERGGRRSRPTDGKRRWARSAGQRLRRAPTAGAVARGAAGAAGAAYRTAPGSAGTPMVFPSTRGAAGAPSGSASGRGDTSSAHRREEGPVSQRAGRNLPVAVASGLVIGALALLAFNFGTVPSMVVVTVVISLAAIEAFAAFRRAGYRPATLLGLGAVAGLLVGTYLEALKALPVVVVLLVGATFVWHLAGVDRRADPVRSTGATLLVFCWVGVFGSFAALLLSPSLFPHRTGIAYLLGALIAGVAYDVGALAVGAGLGRHPLSAVSPGKTWEGLVGGAVAAVVVAGGVVHLIHPWTLAESVVLGVVVAVVSPIGDLCESLVKRHLGLKDMGRILPGHGGLLDRIDGLLFVLPATYYLVRAFH